MKIKSVTINRFRGYSYPITIEINDLFVLVGRNDKGKSTILEALDIFFNEGKGCVKIDKDDTNKECLANGEDCIEIGVEFTDLPPKIIIDTTNETTLNDEYLVTTTGTLHVIKRYPNAGKEKVFIRALHPTNTKCADLLLKKHSELKKIVEENSFNCKDKSKKCRSSKSYLAGTG